MSKIQQLVKHFDGQSGTARALGCSQPCVHYWLRVGRMGAVYAWRAEEVTGGKFRACELCPDIPKNAALAA